MEEKLGKITGSLCLVFTDSLLPLTKGSSSKPKKVKTVRAAALF